MGTDIHPIVQYRPDANSPWQRADIPKEEPPNEYWDILNGRNYNFFAVLGNVRNGTGFAGIRTSAGFAPISDGRGFPDDLGMELDDYFTALCPKHTPDAPKAITDGTDEGDEDEGQWGCDECIWFGDHSHSWVTLGELQSYDWAGQKTALVGVIPLARPAPIEGEDEQKAIARRSFFGDVYYLEYRKSDQFDRMPGAYSGSVSGGNVITIDEPQVQATIDAGLDPTKSYYVRLARSISVLDAVGHFVTEDLIPWLERLGEPDNVRIVFGFDS